MTESHDPQGAGDAPSAAAAVAARPAPTSARISSHQKRRNRRRKSKFSRPFFSVAHGLLVVQALLLGVFVVAVLRGLTSGSDLALRSANTQSLGDLALPGQASQPSRRIGGMLQMLIWAYLFGAPAIFAVQRGLMWSRTAGAAKYLTVTIMAVWFVVIMVILIAPNIRV